MASAAACPVPGGGAQGRSSRPCSTTAPSSSAGGPAGGPATSPARRSSASTSATISSANKSRSSGAVATGLRPGRIVRKKTQQVVQWKTRNVQEGIVVVDEAQLCKLIKRDPIEKFYDMDPEPFATGMFASVRRCRSRDTGLQLAAKFSSRLRYGVDCSAEIHHEIALLSLCSPSPRVVKLHDVFQTDKEIILVMEYAPGGDLQTLIDDNIVPYESDVVSFTRQLVEGLAYLHHRKIAHLDIKPQNLVMMGDFPDCDVKLCDFEISRVILEGTEIREILGTPDYVAPEILHYEPITMAADMWSLGVTVYVLLTGFSPFGGETDQETFCNISRAQLDFPEELFEDVSAEAQDFIRRLLQRDPRSRPTAKDCLRHPWLSQRSADAGRARNCASCSTLPGVSPGSATAPNLRKYLSKSREALFERVLQRGGGAGSVSGSLGAARAHQLAGLAGRARLCESQMSLVSKSRERETESTAQLAMSPSLSESLSRLSRSREKLYGLRSLSRSQEVLAMCRALPVLRTLTRATTADLSQLGLGPGLGARLGRGTHTSIGSELDTLPDLEDEVEPAGPSSTPATPAPPEQVASPPPLARATSTPAAAEGVVVREAEGDAQQSATAAKAVDGSPGVPPNTTKDAVNQEDEADKLKGQYDQQVQNGQHVQKDQQDQEIGADQKNRQDQMAQQVQKDQQDQKGQIAQQAEKDQQAQRDQLAQAQQAEAILSALRSGLLAGGAPALLAPLMVAAQQAATAPLQREQSTLSSNSESSESTQEGDDEAQADEDFNEEQCDDAQDQDQDQEQDDDSDGEQDEPRFTVAQLITAYNLHDEVVTKSSLDFTMAATDREAKLPPVLSNKSKFPTGPNALRLFIPDIDITNAKPRKSRKVGVVDTFALHASKIVEEEAEQTAGDLNDRLSPDSINNNINNRLNNNNNIQLDAKLIVHTDDSAKDSVRFLRSESLSSETSGASGGTSSTISGTTVTATSLEELQRLQFTPPPAPALPPPQAPPPPPSILEPKKSPKLSRPAASVSSSVQRHRRSASTPISDTQPMGPRASGLSPSPSPAPSVTSTTKAVRSESRSGHNGVSRTGSGAGYGRKSSGSTATTAINTTEKLRRKSTPVFK